MEFSLLQTLELISLRDEKIQRPTNIQKKTHGTHS